MRSMQRGAGHPSLAKPILKLGDSARLARCHALRRPVDRSEREAIGQERDQLVLRQADREHGASRLLTHEPASRGDDGQCVLERQHAGETRSDVLADAMADHRCRAHAPRNPELGEGVLDREQSGLGNGGIEQLVCARPRCRRPG